MTDLSLALQISAIGMLLVFGAILVLWAVMAVMMQIAALREKRERLASLARIEQLQTEQAATRSAVEQKRKAAAIAVAMALSKEDLMEPHEFPLPPTALVSAWQAVMRAMNMNKRGPVR
jgi:Na+-transporting methylmalonyl-CoA/oxaloacetate decarboxylase gamma subunit